MPFIYCRDVVVSEADGTIDFVVLLSDPSALTVTVAYAASSGTGSTISDLDGSTSGTLTFDPGQTSKTVQLTITDESTVEAIESLQLLLSSPTNATIVDGSALASLVDNDTPADDTNKASLSVSDVVVDEKAGTATFYVTLNKAATDSFSVAYSTAAGTATGSDFTDTSGTLQFAAGDTVQKVVVDITDDATAESDELFTLNLGAVTGSAASSVQVGDGTGLALIGRNDQVAVATPAIYCSDVIVGEAQGYVDFVVRLSGNSSSTVSVAYNTSSGSSSTISDLTPSSGTLVFAPGVTTQVIRFGIDHDTSAEAPESFFLLLSSPTNGVLADSAALGTLVDDDTPADASNKASITVTDAVVDEKAGTATFYVMLSRAPTDSFSLAYATQDGTALSGSDFTAASGSLSFAPGQTVEKVVVAISDDATAESDETFSFALGAISGNASGSVQIADGTGSGLIGRSDQTAVATPAITCQDVIVSEADAYVEFVVQLSANSTNKVTVAYTASYQGADLSDLDSNSGTLTFLPGVTTQTIRYDLTYDVIPETVGSFRLVLSSPTNAVLADPEALATLVDNDTSADAVGQAAVSVSDAFVDEKAGTATFYVTLDRAPTDSFTVGYATASGTATSGVDFSAASGTLGFAAGQTVQKVTLNITDDGTAESDELFTLQLGAVGGNASDQVDVVDGVGTAVIGRSDGTAAATPTILCQDVIVSEAQGYVDFVVQLSARSATTVTVGYSTSTASASLSDFNGTSGTLVFQAGVTTQTVRMEIEEEVTGEPLENFYLTLNTPTNAVLADYGAFATIADNDTGADAIDKARASVRDVIVDEKAGTATFYVVLDRAPSDSVSIAYQTTNGTATAGADYIAASGTLDFARGETVQQVTVNIVNDATAEGAETFNLKLGAVSGNAAATVLAPDAIGTALIGASDQTAAATPTISASSVVVSEADGYAEFIVKLSAPSTSQITVAYATNPGTALSSDYSSLSGTLKFDPGTTTQTIRVGLVNDATTESKESFSLVLSSPVNATVPVTTYTATIVSDDGILGKVLSYGIGDDVYVLGSASDLVVESPGGGADLVKSGFTHTLADNVEKLALTGTGAIHGTGNTQANTLTGNSGANRLQGLAGNDTIAGGGGADSIYGGAGNDRLTGDAGNDWFYFDSALNASTNKDTIVDFASGDKIVLDNDVFTAIGAAGGLASSKFLISGSRVQDGDDYLIYNQSTGALSYDRDGSGTTYAAVQFAVIGTHADFVLGAGNVQVIE